LAFVVAGSTLAQEEKKPKAPPSIEKAKADKGPGDKAPGEPSAEEMKMMEAWKNAAATGEPHTRLKAMAGTWDVSTKWRMSPDQPWDGAKGKAEYRTILGGRVLVQEMKADPGSSMDAMMGYPFEGFGLSGYDNVTKQYWSTWTDNMGTGLMISHGTADSAGKVVTYTGSFDDPVRGKVTAKSVLKIESNDKMVYEMYDKGPDGKEFTTLEVTYTRKK
jgi:hypothetical protein